MNLKIKKLVENAVIPEYQSKMAAGLDLTATSKTWDEKNEVLVFGTGLALQIPQGYAGFLFPRSSIFKTGLNLCNAVGCIDADYRGEVKFMFYPGNRPKENYNVGDRVGQLIIMPIPYANIQVVDDLNDTERGQGGWGSTGK